MVPSTQACELAIESNQFKNILDIIGVISKEKARKWSEKAEEEEAKTPTTTSSPTKRDSGADKGKPKKKKGVGYGSDMGGSVAFGAKPA